MHTHLQYIRLLCAHTSISDFLSRTPHASLSVYIYLRIPSTHTYTSMLQDSLSTCIYLRLHCPLPSTLGFLVHCHLPQASLSTDIYIWLPCSLTSTSGLLVHVHLHQASLSTCLYLRLHCSLPSNNFLCCEIVNDTILRILHTLPFG